MIGQTAADGSGLRINAALRSLVGLRGIKNWFSSAERQDSGCADQLTLNSFGCSLPEVDRLPEPMKGSQVRHR